MISLEKGYKDWQKLREIVRGYKNLQVMYDNCTQFSVNNYEKDEYADVEYESITATAKVVGKDDIDLTKDIQVWDDNGDLYYIKIDNVFEYSRYDVREYEEHKGKTYISRRSPYDLQEYYYAIIIDEQCKICRNGQLVECVVLRDGLSMIDSAILKLMDLNSTLESHIDRT